MKHKCPQCNNIDLLVIEPSKDHPYGLFNCFECAYITTYIHYEKQNQSNEDKATS